MEITNRDKMELYMLNVDLFNIADEIIEKGEDVYSYVASKIFNKPYEECCEMTDHKCNPTGKVMRDIAKYICINRYSVDDLSNTYKIPILKQLVVEAFPFTFTDDIDDDDVSDDIDDRCGAATTFLIALTGHVRFINLYESNCKILRKLMHIGEA